MQESELKHNKDAPHIFLPSCYEQMLYPSESKYPATNFDHFIDKEWFKDVANRSTFYRQYSAWFHTEARARLDVVFEYFKQNNLVSL